MNSDTLASLGAIVLSLGFAYVPKLKDWYSALESTQKAGLMAVLLIVLSIAIFAASCGQVIQVGITCDKQGAVGLVQILVSALIANQGAFLLLVRPGQQQPTKV